MQIRRNIYDSSGKDVTPGKKEGTTDGDVNGSGDTLEESLKQETVKVYCHSCGNDCTRVRYHNSKTAQTTSLSKNAATSGYDVCPKCYADARIPSNTDQVDYVKLEDENYLNTADKSAPWTDSELLLLLEGLERFDDNWDSVAEHVRTRTREECVLKFLQLEIEDKYMEGEAESESRGNLGWLSDGRIPFGGVDNPVMSVLSFLANLADPTVTATAAGKTVSAMQKQVRSQIEKGSSTTDGQSQKPVDGEEDAVKAETSQMDIDPSTSTTNNTPPTENGPTSADTSNSPATLALSLVAARSSALASHEERHITSLVSAAVNLQLQKMELKLAQFTEMEALLASERRDLERQKQRLFLDRVAFGRRVRDVERSLQAMKINSHGIDTKLDTTVDATSLMNNGVAGKETLEFVHGSVNGNGNVNAEFRPYGSGDAGYQSLEI